MEFTIECQQRSPESKPNSLRRQGLIPAVLYGHKGTESIPLVIKAKSAELLVRDASVNSTLIQVSIPDLPWSGKALLREVQAHPWRRSLYHLSFFSVASQGSLDVDIPLHFVGEATGVKFGGGSLDTVLNELLVRCAPDRIPEALEIDVSHLKVGDALHVHELPLPEGVVSLGEPNRVVVSVLGGSGGSEGDAGAAE